MLFTQKGVQLQVKLGRYNNNNLHMKKEDFR